MKRLSLVQLICKIKRRHEVHFMTGICSICKQQIKMNPGMTHKKIS